MARYDFSKLCMPLRQKLLTHATRLTNGNHPRAEDLVQDAMVRAWRSWEDWTPPCPDDPIAVESAAKAWLYRIVTNVYLNDYVSRQSRARTLESATSELTVHRPTLRERMGVQEQVETEFGGVVAEALKGLYPGFREVVELYYVNGMRYKEIAKELGIELGTVMSRLSRAREILKPMLAKLAREEYGYTLDGARKNPNDQPIVVEEADADRVDSVVRDDDALLLVVTEPAPDQLSAG